MDKATFLWGIGITLTIVGALIAVVHNALRKDVDANTDDIKKIKEVFATKEEVKEVKSDLNEKLNRIMDGMTDQNKLLNKILLKVGAGDED